MIEKSLRMENINKKLVHDLMPYLKLENQAELIAIIEKLPDTKQLRLMEFVEQLKLAKQQFNIHKITYNNETRILSVDANFHLDSF